MDPQTDLPDLVEDLEVNIDELSTILAPLLNTQLSTTASSLPLLDKAKLYVLAAYSIESLLYSSLQASGVNAKEHAIFRELARLKGYFGKIKSVEDRPAAAAAPKARLDVGAAARFIKHGLAGNDKYDLERAERVAKEKARAQLKARQINKKFDEEGKEKTDTVTPKKRDIEEVVAAEPEDNNDDAVLESLEEPEAEPTSTPAEPITKKPKLSETEPMDLDSAPSPATSQSQSQSGSKKKRSKRSSKKKTSKSSTETSDAEEQEQSEPSGDSQPQAEAESARPKRKQRGKKGKTTTRSSADVEEPETTTTTPTRAPKTRSETSSALADGSLPEKPKRGRGRPRGSGKAK
jgi:exosome complex protein LRP1